MLETGSGNVLGADGLLSACRAMTGERTESLSECGLAPTPEAEVAVSVEGAASSAFSIYPHAVAEVMALQR